MKNIFVILYLLCSTAGLFGQNSMNWYEIGHPYLKNYTHTDYFAHTQNFCATEDKRGVLYFGNFTGILEYDGTYWRFINKKETSKVNCFVKDNNGTIFVGSLGEFGVLNYSNKSNKIVYKCLSDQLKQVNIKNLDIHSGFLKGNDIYFASASHLYKISNNVPTVVYECKDDNITFIFLYNDKIYMLFKNRGLTVFDNNSFSDVAFNSMLGRILDITSIIPISKDSLLFTTQNQGLFLLHNDYVDAYSSQDHMFLRQNNTLCGIKLQDGNFAFGTERAGIIVTDSHGNILHHITKKYGLQNENIKFLFQDKTGTLWAALNNGISKIDISSEITYFDEKTGLLGEINGMIRYNNTLYFYGLAGVFYLTNSGFNEVDGITSGCWNIIEIDNKLLAATSKGLFEINGTTSKLIKEGFYLSLCRSTVNPEIFYAGSDGKIDVFLNKNNKWSEKSTIEVNVKSIIKIFEDNEGYIWIEANSPFPIRLNPSDATSQTYNHLEGFPFVPVYFLYKINNQIFFNTSSGSFVFDSKTGKFVTNSMFNFDKSFVIHNVFRTADSSYMVTAWDETNLSEITKTKTGFQLQRSSFKSINDFVIWNVFSDKNKVYWLCGPHGVLRYNGQKDAKKSVFETVIRKVRIAEDSIIFNGVNVDDSGNMQLKQTSIPKLDYDYNSISFDFSALSFDVRGQTMYRFILEGHDKTWSTWAKDTHKEYSLKDGKYKFIVKSINANGVTGNDAVYEFEIITPLTRRWYAWVVYIVVITLLVYFIIRFRINQLEKEKRELESVITERTQEITSQKEEIELQSLELASKNNELEKISSIVQSINSEINFTKLMQALLEKLKVVKGMESGYILLLDDNTSLYHYAATLGTNMQEFSNIKFSFDEINSIYLSEATEIFDDIYFTKTIKTTSSQGSGTKMTIQRSVLIIVIHVNNRTEGFIMLTNRNKESSFDKRDFSLVRNLKEHLTSAFIKTKILGDLEESNSTLTNQNEIITHQKEDITASIHYASRIQAAVLPPENNFSNLFSDYFIFFHPRDIVSGDFYYLQQIENKVVIIAADSTGHGVPGAFMSLLGISFLKEIISNMVDIKANDILTQLRTYIKTSLRQTGKDQESKDGMDMALCVMDTDSLELQYAGAYNPLYIVRTNYETKTNELIEFKADKMPVGIYIKEKQSFTNNIIKTQKGDMLYLFSDGYEDQFGGPEGSKFMSKKMKRLFESIANKTCQEQNKILLETILEWRGAEHEQLDDMIILGIRV